LNPDQAILIPERQNPLLVHRIVYFQDPTFKKLFEAQKGALPYPPKEAADVQVLTQRMEALERRLAERMVVDFVRPEKAKAEAPLSLSRNWRPRLWRGRRSRQRPNWLQSMLSARHGGTGRSHRRARG
jgi:hypothetical protein